MSGSREWSEAYVDSISFTGSTGAALTNTKPYAAYLDYITVMAYDMYVLFTFIRLYQLLLTTFEQVCVSLEPDDRPECPTSAVQRQV